MKKTLLLMVLMFVGGLVASTYFTLPEMPAIKNPFKQSRIEPKTFEEYAKIFDSVVDKVQISPEYAAIQEFEDKYPEGISSGGRKKFLLFGDLVRDPEAEKVMIKYFQTQINFFELSVKEYSIIDPIPEDLKKIHGQKLQAIANMSKSYKDALSLMTQGKIYKVSVIPGGDGYITWKEIDKVSSEKVRKDFWENFNQLQKINDSLQNRAREVSEAECGPPASPEKDWMDSLVEEFKKRGAKQVYPPETETPSVVPQKPKSIRI